MVMSWLVLFDRQSFQLGSEMTGLIYNVVFQSDVLELKVAFSTEWRVTMVSWERTTILMIALAQEKTAFS
jgi:hypothetical protein